MIKSRSDIKQRAKMSLASRRGLSIGLSLMQTLAPLAVLLIIATIALPPGWLQFRYPSTTISVLSQVTNFVMVAVESGSSLRLSLGLICLLIALPFFAMLDVTMNGAYTQIYRGDAVALGDVRQKLTRRWPRKLGVLLLVALFSSLWGLLVAVPNQLLQMGITRSLEAGATDVSFLVLFCSWLLSALSLLIEIKLLGYSFAPYLVAEYPNLTAREALRISIRIAKGHRRQLFIMQLSFIGWLMLSIMSAMVIGVLYVLPYMQLTWAGYYIEIRNAALLRGIITPEELGDSDYVIQ